MDDTFDFYAGGIIEEPDNDWDDDAQALETWAGDEDSWLDAAYEDRFEVSEY